MNLGQKVKGEVRRFRSGWFSFLKKALKEKTETAFCDDRDAGDLVGFVAEFNVIRWVQTSRRDMRLPLFIIAVCLIVPCPSKGEDFCPQPPKKNHTKPLVADCLGNGENSCRVNDTLRYHCEERYVRKAGTSGLIKCQLVNQRLQWREAKSSIVCICNGTTYEVCPAGPEIRTPDCSSECVSTPTPGESPNPESGTAVSPARILSNKEKLSIGAAGGLFIMIVAAVGIGIRLNHNRGVYTRAGQDEPLSLGTLGNTPTPPQEL